MNQKRIKDYNQLNLDQHAVIEASAGTGKTYTLEHLVVRILCEKSEVKLDEVLLVTFTEKATAELKDRIRNKIREALDATPLGKLRDKLDRYLENFDSASIFTIHGFCRNVLKQFAFENQKLFQLDVEDDAEVYSQELKKQMRSEWPVQYGEHFENLSKSQGTS